MEKEKSQKNKKVKYNDWMESGEDRSESEEGSYEKLFQREHYEGKKGHLLLQLQKSYKGDDRFQLSKDFDIDIANKKNILPDNMMAALDKREQHLLDDVKKTKKKKKVEATENDEESFDEDKQEWDPELDQIDKEKSKSLAILGKIVPQSEIFLKTSGAEDPRRKQLHIKRFDPTNPATFSLLIPKNQEKTDTEKKKEEGRLEVMKPKQAQIDSSDQQSEEESNVERVVDIKSSSWKSIIAIKKQDKQEVLQKSDFFLSFDQNPMSEAKLVNKPKPAVQEKPKIKKEKSKPQKEEKPISQNGKKEAKEELSPDQSQSIEEEEDDDDDEGSKVKIVKQEKKEKKEKRQDKSKSDKDKDKKSKKKAPREKVPFDELPNKVKKRIEKRKLKREQQRKERKIKIDFSKSEESLLEKYQQAYGDTISDEKLKNYIQQQKLIHEAKIKQKNRVKIN